jgi:type I restriction enzyme R subunit
LIRNAYSDSPYIDRELTNKTRGLLREHSDNQYLTLPGAIHELGLAELEALKQSMISDELKVLNLRKVLAATVAENAGSKPFLVSIGERAQTLAEAYEDRHLTTQQALIRFEELAQLAVEAETQRRQLKLDENSFAIYVELKAMVSTMTPETATVVNAVFEQYPDHQWDDGQRSRLRAQLYKALLPLVGKEKMIESANALMRLQRQQATR